MSYVHSSRRHSHTVHAGTGEFNWFLLLPIEERQAVGQVTVSLSQFDAFFDVNPVVLVPEEETHIEKVSSRPVMS